MASLFTVLVESVGLWLCEDAGGWGGARGDMKLSEEVGGGAGRPAERCGGIGGSDMLLAGIASAGLVMAEPPFWCE